jgi:hypothetical protein
MSRDSIGLAVAEAQASGAEHFLADCPKCRHGIKVRVDELRRRLPADYVLPEPPIRPAPISVKKDEEKEPETPPAAAVSVPPPSVEEAAPVPKRERASKPKATSETATSERTTSERAIPEGATSEVKSTPKTKPKSKVASKPARKSK